MSTLMDATLNKGIVKAYFTAWENFDVDLLTEIFDCDAKYIIRNKKYALSGICEIRKYWTRNKERQNDLFLTWRILELGRRNSRVYFHASFFDIDENVYMHIQGEICFYYNQDNKITKLTECYRKLIKHKNKSYPMVSSRAH